MCDHASIIVIVVKHHDDEVLGNDFCETSSIIATHDFVSVLLISLPKIYISATVSSICIIPTTN